MSNIIERFKKIATASVSDACDQVAKKRCFMDFEIKPRINEKKVVGYALTVQEAEAAPGEVLPPTHALELIDQAKENEVMVISLKGSDRNVAVWGGIMTAGAVANNMAGVILDAGTRDVIEIRRDYDFPVYSRSVSPATTLGRYKTIAANVEVECGGVKVNPGDLIVADLDGVVVVPKEHIEAVLAIAEEIEVKEAKQAKLIIESKSLKKGLDKYNRI